MPWWGSVCLMAQLLGDLPTLIHQRDFIQMSTPRTGILNVFVDPVWEIMLLSTWILKPGHASLYLTPWGSLVGKWGKICLANFSNYYKIHPNNIEKLCFVLSLPSSLSAPQYPRKNSKVIKFNENWFDISYYTSKLPS